MFKKFTKALGISLLLILPLLTIKDVNTFTLSATGNYETNINTYYSNIKATKGKALLGELHDLMINTHDYYSTYDDCKTESIVLKTDPHPSDPNKITDFYTQNARDATWNGGTGSGNWNREHVWCKSLSNNMYKEVANKDANAGTDLHHIRPLECTLNSARNNNPYGEIQDQAHKDKYVQYAKDYNKNPITTHPGGYLQGGTFEPIDSVKGDVARILCYLYMHYNSIESLGVGTINTIGSKKDVTGVLPITNIMGTTNESDAFNLLIKWNNLDKVDQMERTRNEAVAKMQGNRNPFIDHQEYMDAIWGNGEAINPDPVDPPITKELIIKGPSEIEVGTSVTYSTDVPNTVYSIVDEKPLNCAVIDKNTGVLEGIKEGTCTIKATCVGYTSATLNVSIINTNASVTPGIITLDKTSLGLKGTSYATNDGDHVDTSGVTFNTTNYRMGKSSSIQIQNNASSNLYNLQALSGDIIKVVATSILNEVPSIKVYIGTEANPSQNEINGSVSGLVQTFDIPTNIVGKYISIKSGLSGVNYLESIKIYTNKDLIDYAKVFNKTLSPICLASQNNNTLSEELSTAWNKLSNDFNQLDPVIKEYAKGLDSNVSNQYLNEMINKYSYIVNKYGLEALNGFGGNFINITLSKASNSVKTTNNYEDVIIIAIALSFSSFISLLLVKNRRKKQ